MFNSNRVENDIFEVLIVSPSLSASPLALSLVLNRSVLEYQFHVLMEHGFDRILIVGQKEHYDYFERICTKYIDLGVVFRFLAIKESNTLPSPKSVLMSAKPFLKDNFFLIMDDVIADVNLNKMMELHIVSDSLLTLGVASSPKPEKNRRQIQTLIGVEAEKPSKILLYKSGSAISKNSNEGIDPLLVERYGTIKFFTNKNCSGIFIVSFDLLDEFESFENYEDQEDFETFGGDKFGFEDLLISQSIAFSSDKNCYSHDLSNEKVCCRTNDVQLLKNTNFKMLNEFVSGGLKTWAGLLEGTNFVGEVKERNASSKVGDNCFLGDQLTLGENCVVKRSIIGNHSILKNGVRVINSLVTDHVKIKEKALIKNSIILSNAQVEKNCVIEDTVVGEKVVVKENSNVKKCVLYLSK